MRVLIFLLISLPLTVNCQFAKSALIIGNSKYKDSPLANPVNDANDLSRVLEGFGFKVFKSVNATKTDIRKAIINYGDYVNKNPGISLFYYAGHGIQDRGSNFIVPVDAKISRMWEIEDQCLNVNVVLRMMETYKNPVNIIILDACRNNPYKNQFRNIENGLASPQYNLIGSIIAYSTAPGMVASDGDGRNGLYTKELIEVLKIPGLTIEEVFKQVRVRVSQKSNNEQIPWENSSLMGDYYFQNDSLNVVKPKELAEPESLESFSNPIENEITYRRAHVQTEKLNTILSLFEVFEKNKSDLTLSPLKAIPNVEIQDFGTENSDNILFSRKITLKDKADWYTRELIRFESLQFETGRYIIPENSYTELDEIIRHLDTIRYTKLIVEGHTFYQGDPKMNMKLSKKRAKEVADYLVEKGINNRKVKHIGYGGTNPIHFSSINDPKNRRVELRIINEPLKLAFFFNNLESENEVIDKYTKVLKKYEFSSRVSKGVYPNEIYKMFNVFKRAKYDSENDILLIILVSEAKYIENGDLLLKYNDCFYDDPSTCISIQDIKNRIDKIPYFKNVVLITAVKTID